MAQRPGPRELEVEALRRECPPGELGFASTAELERLDVPIGQPRASEAIDLGLTAEAPG